MPRSSKLSRAELVRAVAKIRAAETVDEFYAIVRDVYLELFSPARVYGYHFYDGRLHIGGPTVHGFDVSDAEIRAVFPQLRILDPNDVRRHHSYVRHSSEVYRWYAQRPDMIESVYQRAFHDWGLDWMISVSFFEGDVYLGVSGMGQSLEEGDFTDYDLEALESLYPHLDATFKRCCQAERGRRLGAAAAAAIETHPRPLFVFDGDEMRYANAQARAKLQNERPDGGRFPMVEGSQLVPKLLRAVAAGNKTFQGAPLTVMQYAAWPEVGIEAPRIVMLERRSALPPAVSPREAAAVAAAARHGVERAAKKLGVTASTLRTHLKNAYRKLGATNLNEAVVLLRLGR